MNTERNSYTTVNESLFSILTLVLGLGLFLIISIATYIFNILHILGDSDVLNKVYSEWYELIEVLPYILIFFSLFFLIMFYFSRWMDNMSVSPSYHYPSFFGSKIFRRIMRVLSFVHGYTFLELYGVRGGFIDNFEKTMGTSHAMLFCLFIILISRLIERDNKNITNE